MFFTLVGELGLTLHKMFEVLALSMGEVPYKEYIPTSKDLNMLKAKDVCIYKIYWEMMCHFRICPDISGITGQGVGHKVWATYLFRNLQDSLGSTTSHTAIDMDKIQRRIAVTGDVSYTTESDENGFKATMVFKSFHYQARFPVPSRGLITWFIML